MEQKNVLSPKKILKLFVQKKEWAMYLPHLYSQLAHL